MSKGSKPPPPLAAPETIEILSTGAFESEGPDSFLRAVAATSLRSAHVAQLGRTDTSLASYRLGERIGSGGMGIVYRAEDAQGRAVALKVLRQKDDAGPEQQRRFLREARSAFAVQHENVARVFEIGQDGDEAFIAMELLGGESLRARLARERLQLIDVVRLALHIARGVAAAHAVGVIHRDLKPENVMVEPGGVAKVLDFGLARSAQAASLESQLTVEGGILGTPGYMSPEQGRGLAVDARTDVFSLGVVMFEMVAGQRPFHGETKIDVLIATSRQPALDVSTLRPGVPARLGALVAAMLAKDPAERPRDAAAVVAELEAIHAELSGSSDR